MIRMTEREWEPKDERGRTLGLMRKNFSMSNWFPGEEDGNLPGMKGSLKRTDECLICTRPSVLPICESCGDSHAKRYESRPYDGRKCVLHGVGVYNCDNNGMKADGDSKFCPKHRRMNSRILKKANNLESTVDESLRSHIDDIVRYMKKEITAEELQNRGVTQRVLVQVMRLHGSEVQRLVKEAVVLSAGGWGGDKDVDPTYYCSGKRCMAKFKRGSWHEDPKCPECGSPPQYKFGNERRKRTSLLRPYNAKFGARRNPTPGQSDGIRGPASEDPQEMRWRRRIKAKRYEPEEPGPQMNVHRAEIAHDRWKRNAKRGIVEASEKTAIDRHITGKPIEKKDVPKVVSWRASPQVSRRE